MKLIFFEIIKHIKIYFFFFFNDTAPTDIYPLPLHDALPISVPLMGHRLSKIYTRTGDGGDTGLGDGSRTRKDSPRVVALGEIDELNSTLGVQLAEEIPGKIDRKSTRLNSSHSQISYAVFCLK